MRINVVTDQFYITKLTRCPLERIQKDLDKQNFKNCERGTRGDYTAEQICWYRKHVISSQRLTVNSPN